MKRSLDQPREEFHMSKRQWKRDLTMNVFVPLMGDDIAALQSRKRTWWSHTTRESCAHLEFRNAHPETPYYFGPHPIRWVQVTGVVGSPVFIQRRDTAEPVGNGDAARAARPNNVHRKAQAERILSFDVFDNLGELPARCIIYNAAKHVVSSGDLVRVLGELSIYQDTIQVRAISISKYDVDLSREFMFREEILAVRRYVLERPVKQFEALLVSTPPQKTLIEVDAAPLAGLHRSLAKSSAVWGYAPGSHLKEGAQPVTLHG